MFRRVLSTFTILLLGAQQAFSVGLTVTNLGNPVISPSQIQQNVNVTYSASGQTTLSVRALDNVLTNLSNPDTPGIPVTHIFVTNAKGRHQLGATNFVDVVNANHGLAMAEQNENMLITIENTGALPAGIYSTRLEFKDSTGNESMGLNYSTVFMLNVAIPKSLELSSRDSGPRITFNQENVLNNNAEANNTSPTHINVKANMPWKMYLDTTNMETLKGKYYFRVKNVTGSAKTDIIGQRTELKQGQRYPIASGTQTNNNTPTNVLIEYQCRNDGPGFMKAGQYINTLQYILEEN